MLHSIHIHTTTYIPLRYYCGTWYHYDNYGTTTLKLKHYYYEVRTASRNRDVAHHHTHTPTTIFCDTKNTKNVCLLPKARCLGDYSQLVCVLSRANILSVPKFNTTQAVAVQPHLISTLLYAAPSSSSALLLKPAPNSVPS